MNFMKCITKRLKEGFPTLDVYVTKQYQNVKRPCFMVYLLDVDVSGELGIRRRITYDVRVVYFGTKEESLESIESKMFQLYTMMEYVKDEAGHVFRAQDPEISVEEDHTCLDFMAKYTFWARKNVSSPTDYWDPDWKDDELMLRLHRKGVKEWH